MSERLREQQVDQEESSGTEGKMDWMRDGEPDASGQWATVHDFV